MKRAVITVVGVSAVVTVLSAGAWVWASSKKDSSPVSSAGGSVVISGSGGDSKGSEEDVTMNAQAPAQTPAPTTQTNKGVATSTTNSTRANATADNSPAASLPEPSGFGVYDQYKNAANALYIDVAQGTGAVAANGNTLSVGYRGWLTDGKEFDESYSRNQPFSFVMGAHSVIAGWEQGLMGMKVGGKRRLVIPPVVGYGDAATGSIPADSLLVFDVELVSVK